jgi:hypothetical protein
MAASVVGRTGWHGKRFCRDEKGKLDMTKTLDAIAEAIRNSKHPFRKADSHPKKAQKHRHERRKIKEFLHISPWAVEEST